MADHWWTHRKSNGLCLISSRTPPGDDAEELAVPGQTLSLAASLLQAADRLTGVPDLVGQLRQRADVYVEGFLDGGHDLTADTFVVTLKLDTGKRQTMPVWASYYGVWPRAAMALNCLCVYRYTHDERLLDWARAAAQGYLTEPLPADSAVPAGDAGMGLDLLADLYAITCDRAWLDGASPLVEATLQTYFDVPLMRGASGIDWYESQMGPGFLLLALARLAMMESDPASSCPLTANYTAR